MSEITRNTEKLENLKFPCPQHPTKDMNFLCFSKECPLQGMQCYSCIHSKHNTHKQWCLSLDKFLKLLYTARRKLKSKIEKDYIAQSDKIEHEMALTLINISTSFNEEMRELRLFIEKNYKSEKGNTMKGFKHFDSLYKACLSSKYSQRNFTGLLMSIMDLATFNEENEIEFILNEEILYSANELVSLNYSMFSFLKSFQEEIDTNLKLFKDQIHNGMLRKEGLKEYVDLPNEWIELTKELNMKVFSFSNFHQKKKFFQLLFDQMNIKQIPNFQLFVSYGFHDFLLSDTEYNVEKAIESCKFILFFSDSIKKSLIMKVLMNAQLCLASSFFKFQNFELRKLEMNIEEKIGNSDLQTIICSINKLHSDNTVEINATMYDDQEQSAFSNSRFEFSNEENDSISSERNKILTEIFIKNELL